MNNTESYMENVGDVPSIADAAKNVAEKGEAVASKIANKAKDLKPAMKDAVDRAGRAVNKGYEKAVEKTREAYEQSRDTAGRWEQYLEECIQKRPISSILVAVSLGCVLGMVWSHGSKR